MKLLLTTGETISVRPGHHFYAGTILAASIDFTDMPYFGDDRILHIWLKTEIRDRIMPPVDEAQATALANWRPNQ